MDQKKEIRFIEMGDLVLSSSNTIQKVLAVESLIAPRVKRMIRLADFWITRGHPIFIKGTWMRPDELFNPIEMNILDVFGIYNLRLDDEHTILVGGSIEVVCCTLGKYCGERLERLHPNQNSLYGPHSNSSSLTFN